MALELVDLFHRYGARVALAGVSIEVRPGECYGLVGPNGAGKTTLLRQALLLFPGARGGRVRVDGFDARSHPREVLARLSGTIEEPGLWETLDGRTHLELAARLAGATRAAARARALDLLERFGVAAAAREPLRRWSQGMRQRLAVALALVARPRYLLLDEPTNALDPEGIADVRELLLAEVRERRLGLLVSSHQLAEVEQWCDRVGFLRQGRLVLEVERAELARRSNGHVTVRTDDDARAARVCAELGLAHEIIANAGLEVRTGERGAPDLVRALVREGVALHELVARRASLEDLYLEVARGPAGVSQDAPRASENARERRVAPRPIPAASSERLAPTWPLARMLRHELSRVRARPRALVWLLLPTLLAAFALVQEHVASRRALAELDEGTLYSATGNSAFQLLASGLRAGLPLLALVLCGAASQMLAGELGRRTHRLLLVQPIGRRAIVAGKLAALACGVLAAFVVSSATCVALAAALSDFTDVVEILPNGKPYPLVAASELWPALGTTLPSLLLATLALASIGFAAGALARTGAAALGGALAACVALELARAPARIAGFEDWLPTTWLPSPLGDRSMLAGFADLAQGVSNASTASSAAAALVPLGWCALAVVLAFATWMRRSFP